MKKPLQGFYFEDDNADPPMGYCVAAQSRAAAARFLRQRLGRQITQTRLETLSKPISKALRVATQAEGAVLKIEWDPIEQQPSN